MLHELRSQEYRMFTQILREPKDDYARRKVQKDRNKVKKLLDGILKDREAIIFYKDNTDVEHFVVGTCKKQFEREVWPELPIVEPVVEIVNNQEVLEIQHILFWEFPLRKPIVLHVDSITKVIIHHKDTDEQFFTNLRNGTD